jgi:hypothetical protein
MVVDMDGPQCQGFCPNRGCLEAVASGTALVREASLAVARRPDTALGRALEEGRELTGPLITELAGEGDPVAAGAIALIGRRLGVGIASLVNIFNPEYVVIGGGVSAAGDLLLDPAREVMRERALSPNRDVVRVEAAAFGAEAGMMGAALMAREGTGIARAPAPSSGPSEPDCAPGSSASAAARGSSAGASSPGSSLTRPASGSSAGASSPGSSLTGSAPGSSGSGHRGLPA